MSRHDEIAADLEWQWNHDPILLEIEYDPGDHPGNLVWIRGDGALIGVAKIRFQRLVQQANGDEQVVARAFIINQPYRRRAYPRKKI